MPRFTAAGVADMDWKTRSRFAARKKAAGSLVVVTEIEWLATQSEIGKFREIFPV